MYAIYPSIAVPPTEPLSGMLSVSARLLRRVLLA
jgi:hypothetical protein